jgi:hypothetical protein
MKPHQYNNGLIRLTVIKMVHTAVWVFFNVVLGYLAYAVIANKIDKWVWIGLGLFAIEGIVLLFFKMVCPLTIIARKYSDSTRANFDIYLPEWLARYNKPVYSIFLGIIIMVLIYRLITNK